MRCRVAWPWAFALAVTPVWLEAQRTQLLVVSGVGGEPRSAEAFRGYGAAIALAGRTRFALPESSVVLLAEDSTKGTPRPNGRSTKDNVERVLSGMVRQAKAGDQIVVVLFGHGSENGVPRINLPGPDMTEADFVRVLAPATEPTVVVINTASASGTFAKALAGKNRIVITATKSAREANETRFPAHFVKALAEGAGDTDKDGRVSMLEAFTYARLEVEKVFATDNLLPTEHPQLEDDGDGVARGDASEKGPDGPRSRALFLEPLGGAQLANDPRAARLLAERREVEARIDSLRARRATMSEEAYQRILEPLVLLLAEKTQALRALEGKKP
jgi:hypothetical protein